MWYRITYVLNNISIQTKRKNKRISLKYFFGTDFFLFLSDLVFSLKLKSIKYNFMQHILFSLKNVKDNRTKNHLFSSKNVVFHFNMGFLIVLIISLDITISIFFVFSKIALLFLFMIEMLYSKSDKELKKYHV